MQPVISVITPTFNHQNYINECIDSVRNQSFKKWEMIIIDDGSTDRTLENAKKYTEVDNRIRIYTQENIGIFRLVETYNKALSYSNGKYVAIIEGDDNWEPNKLELQVKLFEENNDMILNWGQARCISYNKKIDYNTYPNVNGKESTYYNNDPVGNILNLLLYKDCIPALTILVRKDALIRIGGFTQPLGMPTIDLPTLLQLSLVGKFGFIPKTLGSWRVHEWQTTKVYPVALSEGYFKLVIEFIKKNAENKIVKNINIKSVIAFHRRQIAIAYSRSGRYKLVRKKFAKARQDYLKSIIKGGFLEPGWMLRSVIGIIFSLLHKNVEGLWALLGKKTYSDD
ncbi:MAG: glycosyltransferase family 2 protein [Bacteroidales bacterium]|nr:glycosyltransferase family 2 protein [Bacteroidales bacterium]